MYPNDSLENWYQGQGHWSDVPAEDWNNWKWQLKNRLTKLEHLEDKLQLSKMNGGLPFYLNKLALSITPTF